jgi:hypothetical protein
MSKLFLHGSLLLVILFRAAPAPAQSHPAPFYAVAAVGEWAEFDWLGVGPGGEKQSGHLRLSCVGRLEIAGMTHFWIEVCKDQRAGDKEERFCRKVLAAESSLRGKKPLVDGVMAAYAQNGRDGPITTMTRERLRRFLNLGFEGATPQLKEMITSEVFKSELGSFKVRHVVAEGSVDGRKLKYHAWLTERVPFGFVCIEMRDAMDIIVFRGILARTGHDARSELDETKAERK